MRWRSTSACFSTVAMSSRSRRSISASCTFTWASRSTCCTFTDSATTCCCITLRSEEHTSELQSPCNLVCRLLLEKKKNKDPLTASHPLPALPLGCLLRPPTSSHHTITRHETSPRRPPRHI